MKNRMNGTLRLVPIVLAFGVTACSMLTAGAGCAWAQNGKTFAVTQNSGNDRDAIQKTIDEATAKGGIAYLPAGEYKIDGDLWLASNSILRGDGDATVLRFSKGEIRSLKNGSTNFYYTNNYNNEVIPNAVTAAVQEAAAIGARKIVVDKAAQFRKGEWVYTDDKRKDTWAILEDGKRSQLWNDPATPLSRQQIFQVTEVAGNTIALDKPLYFPLEKGSLLQRHVGARNFEISSLKIVNLGENHPLIFEQPMDARFLNLTVEAAGGITLTHKPYNNLIQNCRFITTAWRGVTVEYFGVKNRIVGNEIEYVTGGDCALLVMFSSSDNDVAHNTIRHAGPNKLQRDEGGIYIHATSFHNTVHHNTIDGTLEALGNYYGAENNIFFENVGTNVRVGIMSYYARNNIYAHNRFSIVSKPPVAAEGAVVYGSFGNLFKGNQFTGNFVDGIMVQGSHHTDILDNVMTGAGPGISTYGIRSIGNDAKTGDDFQGVDPKSGLRRGNVISNIKIPEGS